MIKRIVLAFIAFLMLSGIGSDIVGFGGSPAFAADPPATTTPAADPGVGQKIWDALFPDPTKQAQLTASDFVTGFGNDCWACTVFDKFSGVVFSTGHNFADGIKTSFAQMLATFSVLFSLVYLGGGIIVGDAGDMAQRWKVFWRLMLATAAGSTIIQLNAFDTVWTLIYGPLMDIPLGVEQTVTQGTGGLNAVIGNLSNAGTGGCSADQLPNIPNMVDAAKPVMTEMRNIVCGGHQIALYGMGWSFAIMTLQDGLWGTVVNIVCGVAMMFVFMWMWISFPLRFIDVLLRLTVVGVLTPVIVICAVFKPTRSYAMTAISNVLYCGCVFAFTGIMFYLGGLVFTNIMAEQTSKISGSGNIVIASLIGQDNPAQVLARGLIMIGAAVIMSSMVKMAPAIAAEFSGFRGSTSSGVGDAAAGVASGAASMTVKGAGLAAGGVGGAVMAGRAASAVGAAASEGAAAGVAGSLEKGVAGAI